MARATIASLSILSLSLAAAASHSADNPVHDHGGAQVERGISPPIATNRQTQDVGRAIRIDPKGWTRTPLLLPVGRGDRVSASFTAKNLATESLDIFGPATPGESRTVRMENGTWQVKPGKPGQGGFHWLKATTKTESEVHTATTFWYSPNHAPSPAAMLETPREGLEIVPQPIPDHDAYCEGKTWPFLVRFGDMPLAGAELLMETEFGSKLRTFSGVNGMAQIVFPRDFDPKLWEGKPLGRTRGNFVVSVTHEVGGIKHLAAFNYNYAPDPLRQRNLMAGVSFTLFGMLLAIPLLLRRKHAQTTKDQP